MKLTKIAEQHIKELQEAPLREQVLQLAQMVTDKKTEITVMDTEYWGLAAIITDEMAEVALTMEVRKHWTFEQMVEKTGIEPKHLQELLDQMSIIGVIEYNWENEKREKERKEEMIEEK